VGRDPDGWVADVGANLVYLACEKTRLREFAERPDGMRKGASCAEGCE
jgi:hypothetical protein